MRLHRVLLIIACFIISPLAYSAAHGAAAGQLLVGKTQFLGEGGKVAFTYTPACIATLDDALRASGMGEMRVSNGLWNDEQAKHFFSVYADEVGQQSILKECVTAGIPALHAADAGVGAKPSKSGYSCKGNVRCIFFNTPCCNR